MSKLISYLNGDAFGDLGFSLFLTGCAVIIGLVAGLAICALFGLTGVAGIAVTLSQGAVFGMAGLMAHKGAR